MNLGIIAISIQFVLLCFFMPNNKYKQDSDLVENNEKNTFGNLAVVDLS